jgi:hypothetical protein
MAEEEIQLTADEIAIAEEPISGDAPVVEEAVSEPEAPVAEDESPADDEPADEPADEQSDPEEVGLSDSDYTLGESYGLTKEEVDDLGSRELLEKFGKIAARQVSEAKPQKQEPEKNDDDGKESDEDSPPAWDLSKIDLDEYDEVTKSAFNAIDSLQKEILGLKEQNSRLESTHDDSALKEFGSELDALDPDFFGVQYGKGSKAKRLGKEQMDRRMKLAEAIDVMTAGYSSQGRPIPDLNTLVKDAAAITFRDRVAEVSKKDAVAKLKKQAARRQSSGSRSRKPAKPATHYDDDEQEIQRILAETDDAYQRMIEEN